MPEPKQDQRLADSQKAYIKGLLEICDWKATHVARAAGLAPSTINKFLAGDVDHVLSARTIKAIETAALKRLWEVSEKFKGDAEYRARVFAERERLGKTKSERLFQLFRDYENLDGPHSEAILLSRYVEGGRYDQDILLSDRAISEITVLKHPVFNAGSGYRSHRIAYIVRGPAADKIYPEGSVLIVQLFPNKDYVPETGHRVISEHRKHGLIEATVKEIQISDDGRIWLWPRSTDPNFQQPVALGDNSDISVVGLVIGSYVPEALNYLKSANKIA